MKYTFFIMLIITPFCIYSAAPQEKIAKYQRDENFQALASYLNTLRMNTLSSKELFDLEQNLESSIMKKTYLSRCYEKKYNQTGAPAYKRDYIEVQQQIAYAFQALEAIKKLDDDAYDAIEYRLQGLD